MSLLEPETNLPSAAVSFSKKSSSSSNCILSNVSVAIGVSNLRIYAGAFWKTRLNWHPFKLTSPEISCWPSLPAIVIRLEVSWMSENFELWMETSSATIERSEETFGDPPSWLLAFTLLIVAPSRLNAASCRSEPVFRNIKEAARPSDDLSACVSACSDTLSIVGARMEISRLVIPSNAYLERVTEKRDLLTSDASSTAQLLTVRVLTPSTAFKMTASFMYSLLRPLNYGLDISITYTFFTDMIAELNLTASTPTGRGFLSRPW